MEHGSLWAAVCEQRLDDLPVRVAVVDLHGQVQLLGERDMLAEGVSLQFLRAFPGAKQVHAGLADGDHLMRVCEGQAMHFGERVVEAHIMVGLVFQRQTVRPGDAAVTVEHGFIGVDCDGGMNGVGMVDGHLDGGHEVRQLAPAVDDAGDADCRGLGEQLLHVVHRYFRLSFFDGFVAHGPRKRNDGCHMRMVVDDVRVVGQRRRRGRPAAVTMMMLAHVSPV